MIWKAAGVVLFLAVISNTLLKQKKNTTSPPAAVAVQQSQSSVPPPRNAAVSADTQLQQQWAQLYGVGKAMAKSEDQLCRFQAETFLSMLRSVITDYDDGKKLGRDQAQSIFEQQLNQIRNSMSQYGWCA